MRLVSTALALFLAHLAAASLARANVVLLHNYELNGNLDDSVLGGPAITSQGGTVGASTYAFGDNQGLTLGSPLLTDAATYSIEMRLRLNAVRSSNNSNWIKLIDFKNGTTDNGLYSFDDDADATHSKLEFIPSVSALDVFEPGQFVHIVITRDGTTKDVVAYGNGSAQLLYTDAGDLGVFSGPGQIMRFWQDDSTLTEAGPGEIDFIRIYDSVLTDGEVSALVAVPEAGAWLFMGAAATVVSGLRLVRTKKAHAAAQ
jgi:hypothetical protein